MEMKRNGVVLDAPGYEKLAGVFRRAFQQSAYGKGMERHARKDEPFHHQVILENTRRYGIGGPLYQAAKKVDESQRLPRDAAIHELLGAMVYLAAAVIYLDEQRPAPANDNASPGELVVRNG